MILEQEVKESISYHLKLLRKHQMSLRNAQDEIQKQNIMKKIKCTEIAIDALASYQATIKK